MTKVKTFCSGDRMKELNTNGDEMSGYFSHLGQFVGQFFQWIGGPYRVSGAFMLVGDVPKHPEHCFFARKLHLAQLYASL